MKDNGYTTSVVIDGLKEHYQAYETQVNLAAGQDYNGGKERVIVIPVTDPDLLSSMYSSMPMPKAPAGSDRLKIVKPENYF